MLILDGGMGQELVRRAGKATDLWAIQSLIDTPHVVREVHDEYFAAGAEVAATNTYSVLPDRLDAKGLGDRLEELVRSACQMAVDARAAHGSGLVAGSLGPIGFSYQPDKAPPADQAAEVYARMARIHADYVDVHQLDTMASVDQGRGGLMGTSVTGKPVWVSFSVDDADGTKLRSGEALEDILPLLVEYAPASVMINCSMPEAVTQAMPILAQAGIPFGACANGFTGIHADFNSIHATVDLLSARKDLGPDAYLDWAKKWVADGATMIGGCCEVGPDHIKVLAQGLR